MQIKIYGAATTNILLAAALLVLFQLKGKGLAWLAMKPERFAAIYRNSYIYPFNSLRALTLKQVQLKKDFDTKGFDAGAPFVKQLLWYFTSALFFRSGLIPVSTVLVAILKLFGAKIGKDVRVKPYIHIKYPWKLTLGDHSWLAECYIENLAEVTIGKHCCVSQGAMLLTGNHNYKSENFDLITAPIILEDGVWVGAKATVCPGVTCKSHAVLSLDSVATKDLDAYSIYQGNPAVKVRDRNIC